MISIIEYESRYQPVFKQLNLEWLEKFNLTEEHDLKILNDPEGIVIQKGGAIFLAAENDRVIGTAGIAKTEDGIFEIIKMTVDPARRGQGISKLLLEKCMAEAKRRNASKIILFSNSRLSAALQLYRQYGFQQVALTGSPMLTADIKMELIL